MKRIVIALLPVFLFGCGVEAVGTAATGASLKKQELEQGQKTMQQMEDRIGQMNLEAENRLEGVDDE